MTQHLPDLYVVAIVVEDIVEILKRDGSAILIGGLLGQIQDSIGMVDFGLVDFPKPLFEKLRSVVWQGRCGPLVGQGNVLSS